MAKVRDLTSKAGFTEEQWYISDVVTKWTFGDAVMAKVRDRTSKAGFTEEQWYTSDVVTKWTFGDAVMAKVRDHTSKAGFTEELGTFQMCGRSGFLETR